MTALVLDLAINPVPLERARVVTDKTIAGTRTRSFTPERSRAFKDEFQWAARAGGARGPARTSDLAIHLEFWRHHKGANRGDLDNLVKAVLDAGNQFLWHDDRQILELHARIVTAGPTTTGRIRLELVELKPPGAPA